MLFAPRDFQGKDSVCYSHRGTFKDGKPHGLGKRWTSKVKTHVKWSDQGRIFDGIWSYDYAEKCEKFKGVCTYGNLEFYDGDFLDYKRHGRGSMKCADNLYTYYEGAWENDEMHGEGEMSYSNGDKFSGEWMHDKLYMGEMSYSNGDKFTGEWMHGKRVYGRDDL